MLRPLRRGLKKALAIIAGALFSGPRRPRPSVLARVLVLRIDERVGNVLLTTPLLLALKRALPEARIDILVAASKRSIVRGLAEPIAFEKKAFFRRPWAFWALLRRLRRNRYDAVIDASHWHHFSTSSALLLALSGGAIRIAHDRGEAARFATDLVAPPSAIEPEVQTKLRLLAPLGLDPGGAAEMATGLGTDPEALAQLARWLQDTGLSEARLLGLAPGSRKVDHRVDPGIFAALGQAGTRLGVQPIVLWGPGEEALAAQVGQEGGAILAPPTDLEALAALMRRCAAVITNDTGPMHLSVACGAPTIALFRGAEPGRWGHAQAPHAVVAAEGVPKEVVLAQAEAALLRILGPPKGSAG